MNAITIKYFFSSILVLLLNSSNGQSGIRFADNTKLYDSLVYGIHIFPGAWRPVFKTEQIAWISPPWPNKGFIWADFPKATDFMWLDFPKAIFSDKRLLFLSHINPSLPSLYNYPQVIQAPWFQIPGGIKFNQYLPNGLKFGGSLTKEKANSISVELWVKNDSDSIITNIQLLTCAYLSPIEEFNEKSNENKFIHVPGEGWINLAKALTLNKNNSIYPVGWGSSSHKVADLPVVITLSKEANHIVAYTWWKNTCALWGNASHPSFNADPCIPDLLPGQKYSVKGSIIFFEGSIAQFERFFISALSEKEKNNEY